VSAIPREQADYIAERVAARDGERQPEEVAPSYRFASYAEFAARSYPDAEPRPPGCRTGA